MVAKQVAATIATNRVLFWFSYHNEAGIVLVCLCVSVSVVRAKTTDQKLTQLGIAYVLRWILEVIRFRQHLTLIVDADSCFHIFR